MKIDCLCLRLLSLYIYISVLYAYLYLDDRRKSIRLINQSETLNVQFHLRKNIRKATGQPSLDKTVSSNAFRNFKPNSVFQYRNGLTSFVLPIGPVP